MPEADAGLPQSVVEGSAERTPKQEGYVHKETLSNGLRVLVHEIPGETSTNAVMFVGAGPLYEAISGTSHFLEHENFEGSDKYPSSEALNERVWKAGGYRDAHTDKEFVSYQIQVASDKTDVGLDYLRELVFKPKLTDESVEREKSIITQEIAENIDNPSENMKILLSRHAWGNHPVARNTLGTPESLQSITPQGLREYHDRFYTTDNSVLVISGNVTAKQAIDMVTGEFGSLSSATEARPSVPPATRSLENRVLIEQKDLQQAYLALTFDTNGIGLSSDMMLQVNVLSALLANSIYKEFRSKLGYSYRANSYPYAISEAGQIVVDAGVAPDNAANAMRRMIELAQELQIDEETVQRSKITIASDPQFNPHDTTSDAMFIGQQELFKGKVLSPDEIKAKIMDISVADIQRLKDTLLTSANAGMVILGNVSQEKKTEFEAMLDFN